MTFKEKRAQPRCHLRTYLPVYEGESGDFLGRLVDISQEGIRLDTEVDFLPGQQLDMCVRFRQMLAGESGLFIHGECVWCMQDPVNSEHFVSGFRIESEQGEAGVLIMEVMDVYGLRTLHGRKTTEAGE